MNEMKKTFTKLSSVVSHARAVDTLMAATLLERIYKEREREKKKYSFTYRV